MNVELVGVVVIGRNEEKCIKRCLLSVIKKNNPVVYVDSGSTDASVQLAIDIGVATIQLKKNIPFTAARGRNSGFEYLMSTVASMKYVQFIDGDCELQEEWLECAVNFLQRNKKHAIVCGHLRERNPKASIYNKLCDVEWSGPVGNIDSCGGIFMIRTEAYSEVGGMNSTIAAGEEPEMCLRLRQQGWLVARIDAEMATHDANMTRFSHWWNRAMRSGTAYAQGLLLRGLRDGRYYHRDVFRISFWGLGLPVFVTSVGLLVHPVFFSLYFLYPLLLLKIALQKNKQLHNINRSFLYASFNVLGKFPQILGLLVFLKNRFLQR